MDVLTRHEGGESVAKMVNDDDLLTVREVADILRMKPRQVRKLIALEDGGLEAEDHSTGRRRPYWKVTRRALEKFRAERSTA